MRSMKGGARAIVQTVLYILLFLCAGIVLAIYSYFLSVLADRDLAIAAWKKAVEGISGAAVVYLIFAICLTCCLAGKPALSYLAVALDVLFCAGMLAIAVMTRSGASSCKGNVNTPIGSGPAGHDGSFNNFGTGDNENLAYSVHLGLACRLNTVAFAVSIIAAFLFLCTAVMQILLVRNRKKNASKSFHQDSSNLKGSSQRKNGLRGIFGGKKSNVSHDKEAGF